MTTSPQSNNFPRSRRPPDLDDLDLDPYRPVHSPPPTDTDSLRQKCQSPRFRRIQHLVHEEGRSPRSISPKSSLGGSPRSPLSPRSHRKYASQDTISRESTPDPPTYRDVITGSPNVTTQLSHFDYPRAASPNVQVFQKTKVTKIESTSGDVIETDVVSNGIALDLNSNFPERETLTTSSMTSEEALRQCPGGDHDHDHRLCRRQLDDLHAKLQAMTVNGTDNTVTMDTMTSSLSRDQDNNYRQYDNRSHHYQQETSSNSQSQSQSRSYHQTDQVIETHTETRFTTVLEQQKQRNMLNERTVNIQQNGVDNVKAVEKKPKTDEPRPSGPCACCPYGYHIDLTFLNMFSQDYDADTALDRLMQIRKNKKRLRKSMEIYLLQEDVNEEDVKTGNSLMTMMEEDERATRAMLNEIDSSVDATIASIDTLIQTGKVRRSSLPELDESELSVGSGPQNTSSPKPQNGDLRRRGSQDSISSLDTSHDGSDQKPDQYGVKNTAVRTTTATTEERNVTNVTNITTITSHQLAVNMAHCFDGISGGPSENMVTVTSEQLRKMREQIALSLNKMKELEEQVRAIPVLQVRISVLKEEKRLLALQNEAKKKRLSTSYRSIGVGDDTIDEPRRSRSRSRSPSVDFADFPSLRRGKRTEETGVGDGDVTNLYYLQPDLVSQEEFIDSAKALLPEHIKVKIDEPDADGLFGRRFAEEDSPWMMDRDSPELDREFRRMEAALDRESQERFFASKSPERFIAPESQDRFFASESQDRFFAKPSEVIKEDSDEGGTVTTTTTTTMKIVETDAYPRGEVIRVPQIIHPPKPITRDFGQMYREEKPRTRDMGTDAAPIQDVVQSDESEAEYDEFGRRVVTTTTVTRSNLLLQEQRVRMALKEALHRDVKSVGINVRFATSPQGTQTEFVTTKDAGCSNDTIDVTVRPNVWLRSIGTEVKPAVSNHSTWTDKQLMSDSSTNTAVITQRTKTTNTNKALTFPAACNTESPRTYTIGVGTDHRTFYAMNLITNQGVETEGLCRCGEVDDSMTAERSEMTETQQDYDGDDDGDDDDSSSSSRRTTTTTVRKRITTYGTDTSPVSISVNRHAVSIPPRGGETRSNRINRTTTVHSSYRSALSDTEADYGSHRADIDLTKLASNEDTKLHTYERHFSTKTSPTTIRYHSSSSRSKPRVSGPVGDSLLVRRVKSYGHHLGIPSYYDHSSRLHEPLYTDQTNLGTYMNTVSTSQTLDIGPSAETRGIRTVTPNEFQNKDPFPRPIVIERSSTSSTSSVSGSEPFVDIVDCSESPTKQESQSDIFGSESNSTIIRKTKESVTTSVSSGDTMEDVSPNSSLKRRARRAKLDGASMLNVDGAAVTSSSSSDGAAVTSSSSSGGVVMTSSSNTERVRSTDAALNLSTDIDIPLSKKLAQTDRHDLSTSLTSPKMTMTSQSMTSSTSTYVSSRTIGADGRVVENISADSEFSSTDPTAQKPEVNLSSATNLDSDLLPPSLLTTDLASSSIFKDTFGSLKTSSNTLGSLKSSSDSGFQEYTSSREFHSVDGQASLKEETTKKVDGEVVEHSVKNENFPDNSASLSVVKPISCMPVRFIRTRLMESDGGVKADNEDNSVIRTREISSKTSSVESGGTSSVRSEGNSGVSSHVSSFNIRTGIPSLSADKSLADFKEESSRLRSRLLRTEAVLGDFSGTSDGDSLLFSNKSALGAAGGEGAMKIDLDNGGSRRDAVSSATDSSASASETKSPKSSPKAPKSIMKKSSGKKDRGEKKAIKFAAGTVGGYVSASSESGTESDTSDTSSGSESSFDEGSYDGREGKITYRCQDDMSKVTKSEEAAATFPHSDETARETYELNAAMRSACETMNHHLADGQDVPTEVWNECVSTVQQDWFRVAGQRLANPRQVEEYVAALRAYSTPLLEKIINLSDVNGNTCLHYAVSYSNFETLSLLLDTGVCDVNKVNKAGYTAIMLASLAQVQMDRQRDIIRYLFREGNVNVKASQAGQTALMLAVSHGRKEMVKLLLDCGADINSQDDDGSTALMCACEHGHSDIVKVLLAQPECNATLVDNDGSTALSIAMESDHRDIAVLLYAKLGIKKSTSPIP